MLGQFLFCVNYFVSTTIEMYPTIAKSTSDNPSNIKYVHCAKILIQAFVTLHCNLLVKRILLLEKLHF